MALVDNTIREALKASHQNEKEFHDQAIRTLHAQYARLQDRIDHAYTDKLDGTITEEFWRAKTKEWKQEEEGIRQELAKYEQANSAYFAEGLQILDFANCPYSLYLQQSLHEQRQLLNVLLLNCTLTNGSLCPTYKKPFDVLAQRVKNEEWLAWFRT